MIIDKSAKIILNDDEKECLKKAKDIINRIEAATCGFDCYEIEFDDDIDYVLDEIQSTIRSII